MKTWLLGLALLLGAGCRPDGADTGSTDVPAAVQLTVASIEATRMPADCGLSEPGFSPKDTFVLAVLGAGEGEVDGLTLTLTAGVPQGSQLALEVTGSASVTVGSASEVAETGSSPSGSATISLVLAKAAAARLTHTINSVAVTVDSLPTEDGQPLAAEVRIDFEDGAVLDQTYSAPLRTAVVLCPTR